MEEKDSLIAKLLSEVKARESEVFLAAKYGKQLADENTKLRSKIDELLVQNEQLVQEKYSLQLNLDTQIQTVNSQVNEMELERERIDNLNEKFQVNEKENDTLLKKIENLTKENQYLKKIQDDLSIESSSLKEKVNLLHKQINNFEDQAEKSLCETDKDESQDLRVQLSAYMLNNKELMDALSQCQHELESAKKNENHLLQMVRELEESVSEKNSELSTCREEMKLAKEEIEELRGEIEILKFDQIDVKKRGNSVFAELDDRRTLVEKEYKTLLKKYEIVKKDFDENKKEIDRARGQMAILQSMVSREYQQAYIDKLEDFLASARQEIHVLNYKLSKAMKALEEKNSVNFSEVNEYDYLRAMLQVAQKKEKELQTEVLNLKTKNMYDNDELAKTCHLLYKGKEDLDSAKQEIFKLKLKIKELEQGIMHKLPSESVVQRPKIEILEGFKPSSTVKEKTELLNKSIFNNMDLDDIIPGELELGEDGFREVKPPRKSNKFILKEFNRIEPADEKSEKTLKSCSKQNGLVEGTDKPIKLASNKSESSEGKPAEENVTVVTEKLKSARTSRHKHSNRRNDNCAQQ